MDEKVLVIYFDNGKRPIFRDCFRESGIECRSWVKNRLMLPLYYLSERLRFLKNLFKDLIFYFPKNRDGLIIIFDTKITALYIRTLRKYNPEAKIVLWYWNELPGGKRPLRLTGVDIWSYSLADCSKFDLLYNSQIFFDSIAERYRSVREQGTVQGEKSFIFMGREKGRADLIEEIAGQIRQSGWSAEINYLSTSVGDRPENPEIKYIQGFRYEEYVEKLLGHQGIIDVAYKENSGLSIRTLESIFLHKKLITTNPLVRYYEFYDENNIYIWGDSKISLDEFLSRPYRPVPDSICKDYLLSSWAEKFKKYYKIK